ncbi:hypothetical protein BGZ74_004840, partial [Mortierella antarctica]
SHHSQMETTARRGGRGTGHRGGWRGGDRGGSRGGDRDRGRGRGSYGGSYQTDERQWGFGRGGDQSDRGGLSAPGRGRGRGGISGEQKVQISSAVRPTTIQVSSEGTDDIIVAVSATNTIQDFARTVLAKKDFTLGNNQLRIRMFVNSCLLNLSNHHNVDVSGLLPALASSSGSSQLKEILLMPMGIDDATSPSRLSFQFVVLPLVGVLTRESVCQSTIGSESNTIYSAVYDHRQKFIEEGIIPCMQKLLSRGSLADSSPAADQIQQQHRYLCVVTSLPCALLAVVRLVYQIVTRTRDAPVTLATTVEKLASQAQICAQISNGTDRDQFINQILSIEVKRLQAIVSDTQDNIIPFTDDTADSSRLTRVPNMVHLHNAFDPPGDLSVNGPRHDNDLVNITAINIFPTHQEINCSRTPFLPSNGIPDAPHFLAHGWKRQVDTHFRLYREDMMQPLRQSIVAFLSTMQRTPAEKMDHLLKPKELRKALGDNVRLNVYGDIQFLGLAVDKHAGCSIEIEFAQPQQILGSKRKGQRAEFWERSKNRLMQGGLVCLVKRGVGLSAGDQDGSTSNFELVLAEVVRRDKGAMSVNEEVARITISLADPLKYLTLLNSTSKTSSKQWFLVESPGAYFGAYRPILRALQRSIPASLPFGKYLAPTVEEQAQIRNASNFVDPPIYARAPTFQYNLAVLLQGKECKLDVSSATSIKQAVRTLQNNSTLDDTQATALVDTLCREVALINGPPGTGKTYIGTALMQVLLGNKDRSKCGPILCICYTNHALDQFLEHLLDKGIPKIVRVGARSKSERLEKYNLQTLMADVDRSYHMRKELREINAELESNAEEIKVLERAMKKDCVTWDNVQAHLKQDYPDLYEQFVKPRSSSLDTFDISGNEGDEEIEDDGNGEFIQVEDKKFRNLTPFESWKLGQDIQEKIKWNARAKENWENRSKKSPRRRSKKKSKKRITVLDFDGKNGAHLQPNQPPVPKTIPSSNRPVPLLRESKIWSMSMTERKSLLDQWRPEIQETLMDHLSSVVKNVQTLNEAKNGAFDEIRCGVLRQCSVVGMTTNGAAKCQELIKKMAPKIIICEEAGEVLESHILSALSSATQHLIMIGDHKQLRPQIETYNLSSDSPKGVMYNLDKSLFERLVTSVKNPLPMSILTTQRRMRPCISNLIRGPLYPGLEDGDNVHHYPPVCGMGEDLYFLHHNHPEDAKDAYGMQSFSNSFEVDMAKAFATYLIKNGYDKPGDIAILTPYLGQLSKLRDSLKDSFMLVIDDRDQEQLDQKLLEEVVEETTVQGVTPGAKNLSLQNHLTLRTIDNYQGEEAKIIIISLVRNNTANDRVASGRIGFLKSPNRTNVLLSRAQHGMFILGNATLMEREKNGIWPSVIKELRDHNRIGKGFPLVCKNHPKTIRSVGSAAQLKAMAPHGGCDQACGYGMPCGHACPLQCHPDDIEHRLIVGPLELSCGHTLEKLSCHQKKNPSTIFCRVLVTRALPACEHEKEMECHEDPTNVLCKVKIVRSLPTCGHEKEMACHEDPTKVLCKVKIVRSLPTCGHKKEMECHEDPANVSYPVTMDKILSSRLADMDVDKDPILVLSCGHALTMTTMDNMMKMDSYYIPHVNPATGTTRYIAKQPLPGDEVKQVSCPACQKPIVHLLRYGRRIKDAQLGKNLKKYQIAQTNALADARERFKDVRAEVQTNRTTYMQSLSSIKADPKVAPPSPNSRKLGKFMQEADPFPFTNFWTISKSYGIPPVHRAAWAKCMLPLRAVIMILNGINNEATKSPTKDAFEVAYSHFYQLHTANAMPLADAGGRFTDGIYVDEVDPEEASAMIQDRIVECGLPADGYGGSSYVESLAEKTTILLWVLHHALVTLEFVGPMTGWYWFVEDLCNCCLVYTELLIEAAMNGRCYQRTALSRVIHLDLMSHQARWMNLRLQAGDKGTNEARSKLADSLALAFTEELKELMESCPVSMKKWCLERVKMIKDRLVTEVKLARGDLSPQRSEFDGIRVIRIKLNKIGEPNTWHRCANGHTYVESGTAAQPSSCPECSTLVGGGDHVLLGDV